MLRIVLFLLLFPVTLPAASFLVDSTADTGAAGTLRWAIDQHALDPNNNTIVFAPALAGQTITLTSNLNPINAGNLTIDGSGAPGLEIVASPLGRIFLVNNSAFFATRDIVLRDSDGAFGGGCIRTTSSQVILDIQRTRFVNCQQRPSGSADGLGGAILALFAPGGNGQLVVRDSQFIANRVYGTSNLIQGGAIYVQNGSVRLERNLFELNTAEDTGTGFQQGGAVFVSNADAQIYDNEFLFNQAPDGSGGALVLNLRPSNDAFVTGNLFAGNVADLGAAVWTGTQTVGSGAPFINFTQNTFLSNTSNGSVGAALFAREGQLLIRSNTFVDNTNLGSGAAHLGYNPGNTEFVSMWNNLFGPVSTVSCATTNGSTVVYPSVGYNLRPDASCAFNGFNDLVGDAGPFLALGRYGGATRTLPPAAGNLALDAANPTPFSPGNVSLCPEFDARGQLRPGDGDADGMAVCDMGAFEWPAEAPFFMDGFEQGALLLP